MANHPLKVNDEVALTVENLQQLLDILIKNGHETIGPTMRHGAIVLDTVQSTADFPVGWRDIQEPGVYRLKQDGTRNLFGYALGPHSWKKYRYLRSAWLLLSLPSFPKAKPPA